MDQKNPIIRQKGESPQAYRAFEEYLSERRFTEAYNNFMLNNPDALTTQKTFLVWRNKYEWDDRVQAYDLEHEVEVMRQTRFKGIDNLSSAEDISKAIFGAVLEEFDIRKSGMTDADMSKFLKIAADINLRATKDNPQVVVNVENSASASVDVSDEVLREIGKRMAGEDADTN